MLGYCLDTCVHIPHIHTLSRIHLDTHRVKQTCAFTNRHNTLMHAHTHECMHTQTHLLLRSLTKTGPDSDVKKAELMVQWWCDVMFLFPSLAGMQGMPVQPGANTTNTPPSSTTAASPGGDATTTTTTTAAPGSNPTSATSTTTTATSSTASTGGTGTPGNPTLAPQMGSQEAFSNMMSQLMGMMVGGQIVSLISGWFLTGWVDWWSRCVQQHDAANGHDGWGTDCKFDFRLDFDRVGGLVKQAFSNMMTQLMGMMVGGQIVSLISRCFWRRKGVGIGEAGVFSSVMSQLMGLMVGGQIVSLVVVVLGWCGVVRGVSLKWALCLGGELYLRGVRGFVSQGNFSWEELVWSGLSCSWLDQNVWRDISTLGSRWVLYSASVMCGPFWPFQNQPPEQRYASQLEQLATMGFVDRDANIRGKRARQLDQCWELKWSTIYL